MSQGEKNSLAKRFEDIASTVGKYIGRPIQSYAARRLGESIICWMLSSVTPEDVIEAVRNGESFPSMLIRCILLSLPSDVSDMITPETIFDWLRNYRPDIASTILSIPGGVEWFESSIESLRSSIASMRRKPTENR